MYGLCFQISLFCFLELQPKALDSPARRKSVATSTLFVANLESEEAENFFGKCIYFLRRSETEVRLNHLMDDIVCGSIEYPFLESMDLVLSELFVPLLRTTSELGDLSKEE